MDVFYCFILRCVVTTICWNELMLASESSYRGTGSIGCYLYGAVINSSTTNVLPPAKLPKECTSFFWDYIAVDAYYNHIPQQGDVSEGYLDMLLEFKKPVFILYGYGDVSIWPLIIACGASNGINVKDSLDVFQMFLKKHKYIAGLVLKDFSLNPDTSFPDNFSRDLATYIKLMKNSLPNMEIGMLINSTDFFTINKDPTIQWFQFSELNAVVDFYVIDLYPLNTCNNNFKIGGIEPVTGGEFSIENLQGIWSKLGIPKDKVLIQYYIYPFLSTHEFAEDVNYQTMCRNPEKTENWCADTLETFYQKGYFAKDNTNGYIVRHVDWDDIDNSCKCNHSFPAFYAILNGFNNAQKPATCKLFDRS